MRASLGLGRFGLSEELWEDSQPWDGAQVMCCPSLPPAGRLPYAAGQTVGSWSIVTSHRYGSDPFIGLIRRFRSAEQTWHKILALKTKKSKTWKFKHILMKFLSLVSCCLCGDSNPQLLYQSPRDDGTELTSGCWWQKDLEGDLSIFRPTRVQDFSAGLSCSVLAPLQRWRWSSGRDRWLPTERQGFEPRGRSGNKPPTYHKLNQQKQKPKT